MAASEASDRGCSWGGTHAEIGVWSTVLLSRSAHCYIVILYFILFGFSPPLCTFVADLLDALVLYMVILGG